MVRTEQRRVVGEFFELFKTPWEFYRRGHVYDVVVTTTDERPEPDPALLVVYGSESAGADARAGIVPRGRRRGGRLRHHGLEVPIHGDLLTFEDRGGA